MCKRKKERKREREREERERENKKHKFGSHGRQGAHKSGLWHVSVVWKFLAEDRLHVAAGVSFAA